MDGITQFLVSHGGAVLFAVVFVEQAGLPLPSAPWLLAAGALSAAGKLNPALAIGMSAVACVIADSLWFYVGRRGGNRVLRLFCRMSLAPNSCVGRTKGLFARHGLQGLVAAKFLPGLGAVMPPLAGALGMSAAQFLLFDTLGALVYGAVYIVAGFLFHDQLQQVMAVLSQFGFSALLLTVALVLAYITFKYVRRRRLVAGRTPPKPTKRQETGMPSENPIAARGGPLSNPGAVLDENPERVAFENVALGLIPQQETVSLEMPENVPASLVPPTPCEV
ncbi:MAG TPA: DedA family protein [Candidatus Acidoferrum sp.]|jgi:membrane protein DedA with SNARE-associated domain|nr:DedA family protein [Candidatus Acidoferrum sp.]